MKPTPEVLKCAMKSSLILYEIISIHFLNFFDYYLEVIV
jgi:hypothetical protein